MKRSDDGLKKKIKAAFNRKAYGLTREQVVRIEMANYDATNIDTFIERLHDSWDRQTVDNTPHAVSRLDWKWVMDEIVKTYPSAKVMGYDGSAGQKSWTKFPER